MRGLRPSLGVVGSRFEKVLDGERVSRRKHTHSRGGLSVFMWVRDYGLGDHICPRFFWSKRSRQAPLDKGLRCRQRLLYICCHYVQYKVKGGRHVQ